MRRSIVTTSGRNVPSGSIPGLSSDRASVASGVADFSGEHLRRSIGLPNEPSRAHQRVTADQSETAQNSEEIEETEWAPMERAVLHFHAIDEAPEHQALRKCRSKRPASKYKIQAPARAARLTAK